ncbi:sugar-binding protein [Timonella senegalensis]|uniref:sugar-binding protein n=1 Tax=Timonella senegalensis TaxID=1465825 RepID=UPI002FDD30D6
MRKTLRTSLALGAVAAMMLAGCSTSERGDGETPTDTGTGTAGSEAPAGFDAGAKIGVSLPQQTSENWVLAEDLFNQGLKDAGFEPMVQFANNGASEQQQQIGAMITSGVKVLIIGAVDGGQLGAQAEEAKKEGITVIAYDRLLTNTKDVDMYIAFDPFRVGELQGDSLLQGLAALKGSGPYNIELLAGSPDDANSAKFFDGAMSKLQPKIDDGTLKILSGQTKFDQVATQGWKAENAQSRFSTIMTANYEKEELHGILSPNDTLARAALTAVDQAGKDYIPVATGQDSEVESVKWVLDGRQYSTIYKDTRELVKESINAVIALQKGEQPQINDTESYDNGVKVVPSFLLEPVVVTKENAKEVYAGDPFVGELVK